MRITLCGSTRFKDLYVQANTELSKLGHTVYSIAWAKEDHDQSNEEEQVVKENLDLVHLDKILNSDCIIVLGEVDGKPYIGKSTRREIVWAQMHKKSVFMGLLEFIDAGYHSPAYRPTVIELPE